MTRFLALSLAAAMALPTSAGAAVDTPVASRNVTLIGNIPELGAVGGHVRTVNTVLGTKSYFMMSGASGVSAYDITVPEAPVLAGRLVLPHFSNEDVEVGGDLMLVSADPQWLDQATPSGTLGGLYVLDISALPAITFAYVNPATGNRFVPAVTGRAGHTTSCVRLDCSYAIVNGVSEVTVVDLRTPSAPSVVTRFDAGIGSTHDAQMDDASIVWIAGSGGVIGYSFAVPASPVVVVPARSGGLGYQHNTWRPNAASWVPRAVGDTSSAVKTGELQMVTEERIYPPGQIMCSGQGRFQTRRIRDTDAIGSGAPTTVDILDTWSTETTISGLKPTAPVCSAHYFHERGGIVAIGWYQQGIRFLDVSNPRDIRQVGYYINPSTAAFGVEWIGPGTLGAEILYTLDPSRGIDILRYDRTIATTVEAPPVEAGAAAPALKPHPRFGYACSIAA